MVLFSENGRSKFESTAYTVLLLAFFFAVGLAGGVLYRLLPSTTGTETTGQTARVPVSTASTAAPAPAPALAAAPAPAPTAKASVAKDVAVPPPTPVPVKTAAAKTDPVSAPATALSAALPTAVPPITDSAPGMSAAAASVSTADTAYNPAPISPPRAAPSDPSAAPPIAAAKAGPAMQPKAARDKHVAAASKAPVPQSALESATGSVRVQFGAFTIEDNAHETQWAVEATGLPVEVTQETTRKGHVLYYVRSQPFADRAAALSAAAAAQQKAKSFVNPVAIDYMIVGDASPQQQAQAVAH